MSVRAKFRLQSITDHHGSAGKTLKFHAVMDTSTPENERYTRWTPSGSLEMTVENPVALEQLKLGEYYYLDFTHAPERLPER